jgi:hypothetical protein
LAAVNNAAEALGHEATQAPQPMQAAASKARSESGLATGSEVTHDRESRGPPGLDGDLVAVVERAHVQLTGGGALGGPVGHAVDHHATRPADPFAAVVVESDGRLAPLRKALVHDVQHFQEGHVIVDRLGFVAHETACVLGTFLAPDIEHQVHQARHYL